jgi:Tol biopolymer transport system component
MIPGFLARAVHVLALLVAYYLIAARAGASADSVSRSSLNNATAAGNSFASGGLNSNGSIVVFVSEANNLVASGNPTPYLNVFARDPLGGVALISANVNGTGGGNGNSFEPTVSSNGAWIAFTSAASNLVLNDTNSCEDIFLRDPQQRTLLLSVRADGLGPANGPSRSPLISADENYVVFESEASDLAAGDANGTNDVFIRDLQHASTRLVSVNTNGLSGNGASRSPAISAAGDIVVFVSDATDIIPGATNRGDIFIRDLFHDKTIWASRDARAYVGPNYRFAHPVISGDGTAVAFKAVPLNPTDLASAYVFRYSIPDGSLVLVGQDSLQRTSPRINRRGNFVAFDTRQFGGLESVFRYDSDLGISVRVSPEGQIANSPVMSDRGNKIAFLGALSAPSPFQVLFRDMLFTNVGVVSVATNGDAGVANLENASILISDDGTRVAFDSSDSTLVEDDLNSASDVFVRDLSAGTTELVSARDSSLIPATGVALTFLDPNCFSSNGQFLAFGSTDNNLAHSDTNRWADIFVRNLSLGTNLPVSVFPTITGGGSGPMSTNIGFGTNMAVHPAMSGNGRYIVFNTDAGLRQGNAAQVGDVYIRDLFSGAAVLVSRDDVGQTQSPHYLTAHPAITADGSAVAYESGDSLASYVRGVGSLTQVYVRRGGTNYVATVNPDGFAVGNGPSILPFFSPDARRVFFYSLATNLTADYLSAPVFRLFSRDLVSDETRLLSINANGLPLSDASTGAVVSADSRFVAFYTASSTPTIYRFDFQSSEQTSKVVCTNCSSPAISGNGRLIAYESLSAGVYQVFLKDLADGFVTLVSSNRSGAGGGNANSRWPQISRDGRYVIFSSLASDLVANDTNNVQDVFARDLLLGQTILLSRSVNGSAGNGLSSKPVLAPDGRTVAFQSFASDLVPGDYNTTRDIFVMRLPGFDSDGDGLDDDWEIAYFNTLNRDGSGDYDGDGQTDRQEFLAGTDPTNNGSVLRVITIARASGGPVTLLWNAIPGKLYAVQFKDDVTSSSWTTLAQSIRASSNTASTSDSTTSGIANRFYRVLLQQ